MDIFFKICFFDFDDGACFQEVPLFILKKYFHIEIVLKPPK